ncbi:MAG: GDCCVxC domain-containing (seleno)protein [Mycobacteriaceae bacterium]
MDLATITCPNCRAEAVEAMPVDACRVSYQCTGCGQTLTPTIGDCCVFCSYADRACPPRSA